MRFDKCCKQQIKLSSAFGTKLSRIIFIVHLLIIDNKKNTKMTKYKLNYFNIKGLGEPIRILLSYLGKEFEDNRILIEDWPQKKKQTLFGKVPVLEINGKEICESTAICRYLAVEAGLGGKNDWENLQIDMIVGTIMDFHYQIVTFFHESDPKKKEELRTKLLNETIPFYFNRYEERVKNNNYIANSSLSWADIFFTSYTECIDGLLETKCLEKYKSLTALKEKIYNMPNIKKWIQKRPDTI